MVRVGWRRHDAVQRVRLALGRARVDGEHLVVAVDRPGRVLKLREDPDYAALQLLPALALKSQILAAMNRQAGDGWNADAPAWADFFDTTT